MRRMKLLLWLLPLVLLVPMLVVVGTLLLNRPPLLAEPGPWTRLRTYFGSNKVRTSPDHPFPELRPPYLPEPCTVVRARLLARMRQLGWREIGGGERQLHAQAVTPLLRFVDDVQVTLEPVGKGCRLQLQSASRVGRADFAANQRHVARLLQGLEEVP